MIYLDEQAAFTLADFDRIRKWVREKYKGDYDQAYYGLSRGDEWPATPLAATATIPARPSLDARLYPEDYTEIANPLKSAGFPLISWDNIQPNTGQPRLGPSMLRTAYKSWAAEQSVRKVAGNNDLHHRKCIVNKGQKIGYYRDSDNVARCLGCSCRIYQQ
jgi:hypothetical protein